MKKYKVIYRDQQTTISAVSFTVDEFGIHFLDGVDKKIGLAPMGSIVMEISEAESKIIEVPEFPEDRIK